MMLLLGCLADMPEAQGGLKFAAYDPISDINACGGGDRDSAVQQSIWQPLLVLSFGRAQEEANQRPCSASDDARF